MDIPKDVWGDYYVLLSSNTTNPVDDALYPELSNIVFSDVGQLANGAYSGARWLFPAAVSRNVCVAVADSRALS